MFQGVGMGWGWLAYNGVNTIKKKNNIRPNYEVLFGQSKMI